MAIPFFFLGRAPFSYPENEFPVQGWAPMLSYFEQLALFQYVPMLIHKINGDWRKVFEHSESADEATIKKIQHLLLGSMQTRTSVLQNIHDPIGIHTAWVLDRTFNTSVVRLPEAYIVSINLAVPILIYRLFRQLIMLPGFFPEIDGAWAHENKAPLDLQTVGAGIVNESLSYQEATFWAMGLAPGERSMNISIERLQLAELLTCVTMHIVISHEVAHIVAGHCDYTSSVNLSAIEEISETPAPEQEVDYMMRLLWEAEATIISAGMLARTASLERSQQNLGKYMRALNMPLTHENIVGLYILCSELLYRLFSHLEIKAKYVQCHPPLSVRRMLLYEGFLAELSENDSSRQTIMESHFNIYAGSLNAAIHALPFSAGWNAENATIGGSIAGKLIEDLVAERGKWKDVSLVQ